MKLILKSIFIYIYIFADWYIFAINTETFFHWERSIKMLLGWIITYIQNWWNYVKIYFTRMYIVCLVKHIGCCELLEIFSSPLIADGVVDPPFFHQTVNKAASCFEYYFSFYLIHVFIYAFFIVFNTDFVYLSICEKERKTHRKTETEIRYAEENKVNKY